MRTWWVVGACVCTMPKRKKTPAKKAPADFEKKKRKVGKVTTNANHTSTEFKSKAIQIRTQRAATDVRSVDLTRAHTHIHMHVFTCTPTALIPRLSQPRCGQTSCLSLIALCCGIRTRALCCNRVCVCVSVRCHTSELFASHVPRLRRTQDSGRRQQPLTRLYRNWVAITYHGQSCTHLQCGLQCLGMHFHDAFARE